MVADSWEHQSHHATQAVHGGRVPEKSGIPERGHEEAHDNGREHPALGISFSASKTKLQALATFACWGRAKRYQVHNR
jgi:hypothetical protein